MARKPAAAARPPARRPPDPLARLAELASRGASAARMTQAVEGIVAGRLAEAGADGRGEVRDWLEQARDQLAEGLEAGREAIAEMDRDDRAAVVASQRALGALEAAHQALSKAQAAL